MEFIKLRIHESPVDPNFVEQLTSTHEWNSEKLQHMRLQNHITPLLQVFSRSFIGLQLALYNIEKEGMLDFTRNQGTIIEMRAV